MSSDQDEGQKPELQLEDGSSLSFGRGSFDDYCVYFTSATGRRHAPRDIEYFKELVEIATTHGSRQVYQDFCEVFTATNKDVDPAVFERISRLAARYKNDRLRFTICMATIYLGMIAEERRAHTRLGKRIKRLGVHQLLIDRLTPAAAANYSRGMRWDVIDGHCNARGF